MPLKSAANAKVIRPLGNLTSRSTGRLGADSCAPSARRRLPWFVRPRVARSSPKKRIENLEESHVLREICLRYDRTRRPSDDAIFADRNRHRMGSHRGIAFRMNMYSPLAA